MKKYLLIFSLSFSFVFTACNKCSQINCQNGGRCSKGQCDCPNGYTGERCQIEIKCITQNNNCLNGGTCNNGKCDCPNGYSGNQCEIENSCITQNTVCLNGGTCNNGQCNCPSGFVGDSCQHEDLCITQNFCPTTIGGTGMEEGFSVQQTTDGGYILAGRAGSINTNDFEMYLVKTDGFGKLKWQKTYGSLNYSGRSVQQTTDGGYVIAGGDSRMSLVKTDANGNSVWQKTFGVTYARAHSVQQTTDGGYIIAGETDDWGFRDAYLVKTDANGYLLWQKPFGSSSKIEHAFYVQQTTDGGYIMVGDKYISGDVYSYIYLVKTDGNGNMLWEKSFGGDDAYNAYSIQQTTDGGYIIAGYKGSWGSKVYLIKTNADGNLAWSQSFGNSGWRYAHSVKQTQDGGYIISGWWQMDEYGKPDVYCIKTDANGNKTIEKFFGGPNSEKAYSMSLTTDGGYIFIGSITNNGANGTDIYLVKTDANLNFIW